MSTYGLLSEEFTYGKGWEEIVRAANPAAGANFSYEVSGLAQARLVHILFSLTTSADAANRYPVVEYQDPDGVAWAASAAAVVVTASTTAQRFVGSYSRGRGEWATDTDVLFSLAPHFLDPTHKIVIRVANIDNTDQLSAITLLLQRFPTGPRGYPEGDRGYRPRDER